MKKFDLIKHPFKLKEIDSLYLVKSSDIYECKIEDELDGKKAFTDVIDKKKKHLHIRGNEILGVSNGLFEFNTPVDFAIPQKNEFYNQFFCNMMDMDTEEFLRYTQDHNLKDLMFPKYPPPILSYEKTFIKYNFKNVINERKSRKHLKEKHALNERERSELRQKLVETYSEEEHDEIVKEIEELFETHKIIRIKRFNKLIVRNLNYPLIKIRKFLPLLAFFQKSGPWRRNWIRLNYNPSEHFSSYKHQVITLNRKSTDICLIEHPHVIFLLEQDKEINLKSVAEENGFLTSKGVDLINLYFDKPVVQGGKEAPKKKETMANTDEKTEESDFEVFDY